MKYYLVLCVLVCSDKVISDPLLLTPYIEQGKIQEGRKAAQVPPLLENIVSYSGFLTVDKRYNSNLFFWFFPAEVQNDTAPLLLWLQGGPGTTSMVGAIMLNGPINYTIENNQLMKREYYWTKTMNVLYIDNPVGTGFSFTEHDRGYATGQELIAENLYSAVQQFLQLFPEYRHNELYLTGVSYAGKYIPSLAYAIDQHNRNADYTHYSVNLKGMIIGNGLYDCRLMNNYADYFYQLGVIDTKQRDYVRVLQNLIVTFLDASLYESALIVIQKIWDVLRFDGGYEHNMYNYLYEYDYQNFFETVDKFIASDLVKKNLHVGNITFHKTSDDVYKKLRNDICKSMKIVFERLLANNNYRIVMYNGQLDLIVPYILTIDFVRALNWPGATEYRTAERHRWYVGDELAGYAKSARNFTEILVRNAGHYVPFDQPKWALDLIERVVRNVPF